MLSWNPPPVYQQNGIIMNYTVTLINYNTGHTFSINTTQLHVQFNSLHAFYNYKCTVAAVTVATGPQISVVFQTPENGNIINSCIIIIFLAPSGSPTNISVVSLNSSILYITWDPPFVFLQNGIIRKYSVRVQSHYSDMLDVYNVSNATELIVPYLKPYSNYTVSVAAHTIETGPYTVPIIIRLPEAGKGNVAIVVIMYCL